MTPSDKITAVLQGVRELADKATEGPWVELETSKGLYSEGNVFVTGGGKPEDKAFIAASRDMLPRLVAALEHEMEIGRRIEGGMSVSEEWLSEHHAELAAILTGDRP